LVQLASSQWLGEHFNMLQRFALPFGILLILAICLLEAAGAAAAEKEQRLLYVTTPGIRDYLEYGGHGVVVFDIDHGHRFLKRIPLAGLDDKGKPRNVKGVAANAQTKRLYVSTTHTLTALDLVTEKILWEKPYDGGCDRLALTPNGKVIYLPSLEQGHWHVVDALSGDIIKRIETRAGAHNTICSLDGQLAFLAGLKSPILRVLDTRDQTVTREVGPFSNVVRPFTVNGSGTLCFVNVNELLGFEIGDVKTGKMLHSVTVAGFEKGPTKRHGCPSHGVGLTPDEKELWLTDAHNRRLHIFDTKTMPPKQVASIELRDEPGWITFSVDGHYAYPSTGDVVDVATHKIVAALTDEKGTAVQSEKMLEIDFANGKPLRTGDQFGLGRQKTSPSTAAKL
jgi:DNA-binding beta-propeller fold protein YncE